jgi:hypothetical protein
MGGERKSANLGCPEAVGGGDPVPTTGHHGASCHHAASVQELHHATHHILLEDLHRAASTIPPHIPALPPSLSSSASAPLLCLSHSSASALPCCRSLTRNGERVMHHSRSSNGGVGVGVMQYTCGISSVGPDHFIPFMA